MWPLLVALARAAEPDPVLDAASAEVDRAMQVLAGTPSAPYYLAARITDERRVDLSAEDGALAAWTPHHTRRVDVEARVGSPALDSSHALRGSHDDADRTGRSLPIDDDTAVLHRLLWREIDERIRSAQERWSQVSADKDVLVDEKPAPDLAPRDPPVDVGPLVAFDFDARPWEDALRRASAELAGGAVRDGNAWLSAVTTNGWFVTSDGEKVRQGRTDLQLMVRADAVAEDGSVLQLYRGFSASRAEDLPSADQLVAAAAEVRELLGQLREAPEQEPYSGPVVLSERASGVFFHEIFGHRVEGHRLKDVQNAQTFKDMVGKPVLPAFLSVVDDPTLADWNGIALRGAYRYDDEGVRAERVVLVEDGVLKGFLQSRSPHEAGLASNGHGRGEPGLEPVSRQGNLLVTASSSVSDAELRARLLAAAKAQGLPYGLWIDDIAGGFTHTQRGTPNAFDVDVLVAHRVWVDGRPDELVRGIDLIGTPLVAFSRIAAAGPATEVFNGTCGAESGSVPVAAIAPALLVSQLETQRKTRGQNLPPLLPPPAR